MLPSLQKLVRQNNSQEVNTLIITSANCAKQDMFSLLFVCLSATLRKNFRTDLKFLGKVGTGQ